MRELRECQTILCNIQYIGVDVDVVNSTGVNLQNFFKLLLCGGKVLKGDLPSVDIKGGKGELLTM
jgi:hypothetical protein